jgi:hypothetical protein
MTDERYNGWTNYETWCVSLWLDNERGTYADVRAMVADTCDEIDEPEYSFEDLTDTRTRSVAEKIRGYVDDLAEMTCPGCREGASFVCDLLSAALSEVNWREIAGNLVEEWEETAPDENELV